MANLRRWLAALAVSGLVLCSGAASSAADHSTSVGEVAVKHSARYTRLLGNAIGKVPARLVELPTSSPTPVRTVGWGGYYGYGPRFYGGYGPAYYGPTNYALGYGGGYYGAGWGSYYRAPWSYYGSAPYGGFYGYGYRPYGWYGYRPYANAYYQPWGGGWNGYGYYGAFPYGTPIYTTGYAGYLRPNLGYYGGCCYW